MSGITVVSGCPGTGKTAVASELAASSPRGVHIEADVFHRFFSHRISPIEAEAHGQNTAAIRAVAASAGAFLADGYDVVVDGVIGSWFLPTFVEGLEPDATDVHYVVLRAPLAETLERAQARQKDVDEEIVRAMHPKFADLGGLERYVVGTGRQSLAETVDVVRRGLDEGRFMLSLAPGAGSS